MLDSSFLQASEAAALAWEVPALALGVSVGGDVETAAVGCDPDDPLPGRVDHEAVHDRPRPRAARSRGADGRLAGRRPGPPPALAHERLRLRAAGDLGRFGTATTPSAELVAELPTVRRFVGVEQAWSYANTGYWLAGQLCAERAGELVRGGARAARARPAGLEATSFGEPDLAGTGPDALPRRRTRARGGRPAVSSRTSTTCCASAAAARRAGRSPRCASCTASRSAASTGSGSSASASAASRSGATAARTAASSRSLLVVPGSRRGLRRPDERAAAARRRCASSRTLFFERVLGARRRVRRDVRARRRARATRSPARTRTATAGRRSRSRSTGSSSRYDDGDVRGAADRRAHVRDHRRRRTSASGSTSRSRASAASAAGSPSASRDLGRRRSRASRRPRTPAPRSSPTAAAPPTRRSRRASRRASPRR